MAVWQYFSTFKFCSLQLFKNNSSLHVSLTKHFSSQIFNGNSMISQIICRKISGDHNNMASQFPVLITIVFCMFVVHIRQSSAGLISECNRVLFNNIQLLSFKVFISNILAILCILIHLIFLDILVFKNFNYYCS